MDPLVSFIMPCKDYEKYLPRALDSISKQNYSNYEVILLDDNSSGNCKEIGEKYSFVRYFKVDFNNASGARHFGIQQAKGKYINAFDADDWVYPDYCKEMVATLENNEDCGFAYSKMDILNETGSFVDMTKIHNLKPWDWEEYKNKRYVSGASLIRKSVYDQVQGWDPQFPYWQDYELYLQLGRITKGIFVDKVLFCVNVRKDNARVGDSRWKMVYGNILRKHIDILEPDTTPSITIVSMFAGRKYSLAAYFKALTLLDYNKKQLDLIFIDQSNNNIFGTHLMEYLLQHRHEFASVKYIKINEPAVFEPSCKKHRNITNNWRKAIDELRTKYVFMWEDDTTFPPDTLKKLVHTMDKDKSVGAIQGCEIARGKTKNAVGAWNFSEKNIFPEGDSTKELIKSAVQIGYKEYGIEQIGAGGFFCLLTRTLILKNVLIYAHDGAITGPDIVFGMHINDWGWKFLIDWSIKCDHYWIDEHGITWIT